MPARQTARIKTRRKIIPYKLEFAGAFAMLKKLILFVYPQIGVPNFVPRNQNMNGRILNVQNGDFFTIIRCQCKRNVTVGAVNPFWMIKGIVS
jgi:hypothetical protein